jgi:hypothetical protein
MSAPLPALYEIIQQLTAIDTAFDAVTAYVREHGNEAEYKRAQRTSRDIYSALSDAESIYEDLRIKADPQLRLRRAMSGMRSLADPEAQGVG